MSDYLSLSACNGFSPRSLPLKGGVSRPALIARLLRERHVPRYIVAPSGYGKTMLAHQYADTVFSYRNVFWLDCASPCFLRDLDAGIIAERLVSERAREMLVVFDAVPFLDPQRTVLFCDEVDAILDGGGEVLIDCLPSCDSFFAHRDRMRIGPAELLLADDELDLGPPPAGMRSCPAPFVPASRRVAGIAWGGEGAAARFAARAFKEDIPSDLTTAMFIMFALGKGAACDVEELLGASPDVLSVIAEGYPHFCLEGEGGGFEAPEIPVVDLEPAVMSRMDALASASTLAVRETFCAVLADRLLLAGQAKRACALMSRLAGARGRAAWLGMRGMALLDAGCILGASGLYERFAADERLVTCRMQADEAVRCLLLEDRDAARGLALRVARRKDASEDGRALAGMVLSLLGDAQDRAAAAEAFGPGRAEGEAAGLWDFPSPGEEGAGTEGGASALAADAARLAHVTARFSSSPSDAVRLQSEWMAACPSALCLLSTRFLLERVSESLARRGKPLPKAAHTHLRRLAALLASLSNPRVVPKPGFLQSLAVAELSHLRDGGALAADSLDPAAAARSLEAELDLFSMRQGRAGAPLDGGASRACAALPRVTCGRAPSSAGTPPSSCPLLRVTLFGGLDACIGGQRVAPSLLSRRKVRVLLALLVLNGGKEFSRDRLASIMWPDSNLVSARNNLYGIWSTLRKALETPDGACPYLIRQQQGLRIDSTLLTSDVREFDDLCRTLLFEGPGYGGWNHVYERVKQGFSEDLLPSEDENAFIDGMRTSYRSRLVDALVAVTKRLVEAGEVREGLSFGHAAVMRDRTREDAYRALMAAQLAAGQRTAALGTYFDCRRVLIDEMGIDPSPDIVRLYRRVIETEDEVEG